MQMWTYCFCVAVVQHPARSPPSTGHGIGDMWSTYAAGCSEGWPFAMQSSAATEIIIVKLMLKFGMMSCVRKWALAFMAPKVLEAQLA